MIIMSTPCLTEREMQVLQGMAKGRGNAQIGRDLFLSEDTVKTHARRLFRKLGANDRAHAVDQGWRTGLLGRKQDPPSVTLTESDEDCERLRKAMYPNAVGEARDRTFGICQQGLHTLVEAK